MATVRRWYIFLVGAIGLQSVAWAAITLLRGLLTGADRPVADTAFQIAVVVVGLPLWLAHWLWAQRLAAGNPEERAASLRRLYLYGMLAGFVGPILANLLRLVSTLAGLALGARPRLIEVFEPGESIVRSLVVLVVLAALGAYHWRVISDDSRAVPEKENAATIRRLFVLGLSAAGLWMSVLALIHLLRWLLLQIGEASVPGGSLGHLAVEIGRAAVGVPAWLFFWGWAQRLFSGPEAEERESSLRKFYLYAVVFVGTIASVTSATVILAGVFRALLGLAPRGDLRTPLPIVVGMGVLWLYHAQALRRDTALAMAPEAERSGMAEAPRQAGLRRLYLYLVAGVGLAAFLVGLGGVLSVIIRQVSGWRAPYGEVGNALREQLAWFTAALIAGLPVWIVPWRRAQRAATAPERPDERRSVVRKIYLYFYLLAATLTGLGTAVYILSRLLTRLLGERGTGNLVSDLAQAVAYLLIAVGVWLYHGAALRGDARMGRGERVERLAGLRVAVVDGGEGRMGRRLLDELQRELPGISLLPVGLTPAAAAAMGADGDSASEKLRQASVVLGPWEIMRPGGLGGAVSDEVAQAVAGASARKVLIPEWQPGVDWVGVDRWGEAALIRQAVVAVRQVSEGEIVQPSRPLGFGAIAGIVVAVLVGLMVLMAVVNLVMGM